MVGAQLAAHFDAVHTWEVEVEADDVVGVDARFLERLSAVVSDIDRVPDLGQSPLNRGGNGLFVFDY